MKTFRTDTGRTITAPSQERAVELARQYGLGEVVGLAEQQAAQAARERRQGIAQSFILWDDLCETIRAEGTLQQMAAEKAADPQDHYVVRARGSRGLRSLNAAERRQLRELVHELAE